MGKIPHLSLVASPLVTHGEFYFSPFVALPLMGKNPIPSPYPSFNSSLSLWFSDLTYYPDSSLIIFGNDQAKISDVLVIFQMNHS